MEVLAILFFASIKFAGYFGFLFFFAPETTKWKILKNASIRLIAGVVVGMAFYSAFSDGRNIFPVYLSAILFGRLVLWFALFKFFYEPMSGRKIVLLTVGGTAVSYLLDLPAAFGVINIVGGIC